MFWIYFCYLFIEKYIVLNLVNEIVLKIKYHKFYLIFLRMFDNWKVIYDSLNVPFEIFIKIVKNKLKILKNI